MNLILKCGLFLMNAIYFFIKLFPTKKQVVFLSRQSNKENIDFYLLKNAILKQDSSIRIVTLYKKIDKGLLNKIKYIFHMFKQMYCISTSKVAILDSYCITISSLKHKKNLKVIQMWHALGSFKKFGFSILDKKEGSSSKIAKVLKMHNNYDYVLCSSDNCINAFAEAFNVKKEKMLVLPLPRVDLLKDEDFQKKIKKKILAKYPNLNMKKTILYAPTFRKNKDESSYINKLINEIDYEKYNLIIKLHPLVENNEIINDKVIIDNTFSTIEFAAISDYVITDYSAIIYEIALLNKPMYFWTYDFNSYVNERDFYLNYRKDMPGIIDKSIKNIMKNIKNNNYDITKEKKFNEKYISNKYTSNTTALTNIVLNLLK